MTKKTNKNVPKADPVIKAGDSKIGSRASLIVKLCLAMALVVFCVYGNTLKNNYALDDITVMSENAFVKKGCAGIPEILTTPRLKGYMNVKNENYRPFPLVVSAIEYQLFGAQPAIGHMLNIIFFIACVLVFFIFVDRLFAGERTAIAFIAALLFAVHPIHTEVVANIKSRDELLCFFFGFLSLIWFMEYAEKGTLLKLISGVVALFIAFLSKETVISFLFVIPFVLFLHVPGNNKRNTFITAAATIVAVIFLAIRYSILKGYDATAIPFIDNPLVSAPSISARVATGISVLGMYLKLLVIPYPLVCDYSYNSIPTVGFSNVAVLLSLAIYLSLLIFSIYRIVKNRRDPWAFAILFFLSTLALFSNIPFLVYSEMAERFLFFASAGFCLAVALLVELFIIRKHSLGMELLRNKTVLLTLAVILIVHSAIAINRNSEWSDNLTLDQADIKKMPGNARLNFYLGNALLKDAEQADLMSKQKLATDALVYTRAALNIYPQYSDACRIMGNAYSFLGSADSAIYFYNKAIALNPLDVEAMNNLVVICYGTKRFKEAIAGTAKMLAINPSYTEGYSNIASFYIELAKFDSAIYNLHIGISKDPEFNAFYQNMAYAYKLKGNVDSARWYETIARKRNPAYHVY